MYIHMEREREREREKEMKCICIYTYIYIYTHIYRERYTHICLPFASLAENLLAQTPIEDSGSY